MLLVAQSRFVPDQFVEVTAKQRKLLTIADCVVGNACVCNSLRDVVKLADRGNVADFLFRHHGSYTVYKFHYVVRSVRRQNLFGGLNREERCPQCRVVTGTVFGYDCRQTEVGNHRRVVHTFCGEVFEVCVVVVDTVSLKQRVLYRGFRKGSAVNECSIQNRCLYAVESVIFDGTVVECVTSDRLDSVGKFDVGKLRNLFKCSCCDFHGFVKGLVACSLLTCRILQQDVAVVSLGVQHSVERSDYVADGDDFGKSSDVCECARAVSVYLTYPLFFYSALFVVFVPVVIHRHAVKRCRQRDGCKFGFGKSIFANVLQCTECYACKGSAVECVVAYMRCRVKRDCFQRGRSKCVVADCFHIAEVCIHKRLGVVERVVADCFDAFEIDCFDRYAVVECVIADCLYT